MRVVFLLGLVLLSWCGEGSCHSGKHRPHHKHHDDDFDGSDGDDGYVPVPNGAVVAPVSDPVSAPVSNPVSAPVSDPVSAPVSAPVSDPVSAPVSAPVSDPVSAPADVKEPAAGVVPATGYRKETMDTLSKHSSVNNTNTRTKDKVKVITKHDKDGNTITIYKDRSKTRIDKDLTTDDYNQTNHTVTEGGPQGGVEDSVSLTTDKQHQVKETDVIKKTVKERIVTDKYGNVISDTHTVKEKDKVKKKEKDVQTQTLVHTVKSVPPPQPATDPVGAPATDPVGAPAKDPVGAPAKDPVGAPATDPVVAPAKDPVDAPAATEAPSAGC